MKIIDNIDQKLNILYKNMNKEDYYDFIDSTDLAILQLCEIELSSSFRGIVKQIKKEG